MNKRNLKNVLNKGQLVRGAHESYELSDSDASAVRIILAVDKDKRYHEDDKGGVYYTHDDSRRMRSKVLFKRIDKVWVFNSQYSFSKDRSEA